MAVGLSRSTSPKAICARGGTSAAITERTVCISVTCCSSERTPRAFVDITDPIATIETATTASATSTSMIVKPAVAAVSWRRCAKQFRPFRSAS